MQNWEGKCVSIWNLSGTNEVWCATDDHNYIRDIILQIKRIVLYNSTSNFLNFYHFVFILCECLVLCQWHVHSIKYKEQPLMITWTKWTFYTLRLRLQWDQGRLCSKIVMWYFLQKIRKKGVSLRINLWMLQNRDYSALNGPISPGPFPHRVTQKHVFLKNANE